MKPVKKEKKRIIWVLIYTKARQEKKANENLQRQGFKTFLPLIASTNKNCESKSLVPVFPRYIFAQINLEFDNWTSINSTYGVSHIVMFSDKFSSIPTNIIQSIQNKLDQTGTFKEHVSIVDYQKGDLLSIKEGQFAGVDAIFLSKRSKDRVRLLLKLLNTSVIAEITASDLGNKEVIENFKL
tara:strand:+ start:1534 stop:2082 length:549 start_codon:yes stop_codon:yes gene_type:complete